MRLISSTGLIYYWFFKAKMFGSSWRQPFGEELGLRTCLEKDTHTHTQTQMKFVKLHLLSPPLLTHPETTAYNLFYRFNRSMFLKRLRRGARAPRAGSYLLVARLPGEVQEAGGEQLIFGPAITVHDAPARVRWRSRRSFGVANGDRPSTSGFSSVRSLCPLLLLLPPSLASPSGDRGSYQTSSGGVAGCCFPSHVAAFSPKKHHASGTRSSAMVTKVGCADRLKVPANESQCDENIII